MKSTLMADIPTELESIDIEKKFMNMVEDILTVKRLGAMFEICGKLYSLDQAIDAVTAFEPFDVHIEQLRCRVCNEWMMPGDMVGAKICFYCCRDKEEKKQTHSIFTAKHGIRAVLVNRETGKKIKVAAETCSHPWKDAKGQTHGPCLDVGPFGYDVVDIKI